jgi:hypothetical protein
MSDDNGEQAEALRGTGAEVISLRPNPERAELLRSRGLQALDLAAWCAAPIEHDAAVVSVRWAGVVRRASGLVDLRTLLSRASSSLRAGGFVALLQPNPIYRCAVSSHRLTRLTGVGASRDVMGWPISTLGPLSSARLRQRFHSTGLSEVRCYAPLPDGVQPKFLVPLGDRRIRDYFFSHLLPRPGTATGRVLLRGASLLARCGLFELLIPARQIIAHRGVAT